MSKLFEISEEEKNRILEMHGKEKMVLSEQSVGTPVTPAAGPPPLPANYKDPELDTRVIAPLLGQGYKIVPKINLADGKYKVVGMRYQFSLYDMNNVNTRYIIITADGIKSVQEMSFDVTISGGVITDWFQIYKILYK